MFTPQPLDVPTIQYNNNNSSNNGLKTPRQSSRRGSRSSSPPPTGGDARSLANYFSPASRAARKKQRMDRRNSQTDLIKMCSFVLEHAEMSEQDMYQDFVGLNLRVAPQSPYYPRVCHDVLFPPLTVVKEYLYWLRSKLIVYASRIVQLRLRCVKAYLRRLRFRRNLVLERIMREWNASILRREWYQLHPGETMPAKAEARRFVGPQLDHDVQMQTVAELFRVVLHARMMRRSRSSHQGLYTDVCRTILAEMPANLEKRYAEAMDNAEIHRTHVRIAQMDGKQVCTALQRQAAHLVESRCFMTLFSSREKVLMYERPPWSLDPSTYLTSWFIRKEREMESRHQKLLQEQQQRELEATMSRVLSASRFSMSGRYSSNDGIASPHLTSFIDFVNSDVLMINSDNEDDESASRSSRRVDLWEEYRNNTFRDRTHGPPMPRHNNNNNTTSSTHFVVNYDNHHTNRSTSSVFASPETRREEHAYYSKAIKSPPTPKEVLPERGFNMDTALNPGILHYLHTDPAMFYVVRDLHDVQKHWPRPAMTAEERVDVRRRAQPPPPPIDRTREAFRALVEGDITKLSWEHKEALVEHPERIMDFLNEWRQSREGHVRHVLSLDSTSTMRIDPEEISTEKILMESPEHVRKSFCVSPLPQSGDFSDTHRSTRVVLNEPRVCARKNLLSELVPTPKRATSTYYIEEKLRRRKQGEARKQKQKDKQKSAATTSSLSPSPSHGGTS